jgi:hypothetical protein
LDFFSCSCEDETGIFRVDPETLMIGLETVDERDENEAFAPERPTQEKWNELLGIVRRAEVLRAYIYGLYGTGGGGGLSNFFHEMMFQLKQLIWMVVREEAMRKDQDNQEHEREEKENRFYSPSQQRLVTA